MTTELKQVEEKIEVEGFNPMSRRNPSSRYWQVFTPWKKAFKALNSALYELDKATRNELYKSHYTSYYKKHYSVAN